MTHSRMPDARAARAGILAVFVLWGTSACEGEKAPEQPPVAGQQPGAPPEAATPEGPEPEAGAVWAYLQTQNYRKAWSYYPGKGALYQGQEPHGALLTTYVNDKAHSALSAKAERLPEGAILVKENYKPDKTLAATTVMYKVSGYNAEHNDWFWLKRLADGTVEASGKVEGCQACHGTSQRDHVLTPLPN